MTETEIHGRPAAPDIDCAAWPQAFAADPEGTAARTAGPFSAATAPSAEAAGAVDRFARETLCVAVRDGKLVAAPRADRLAAPGAALDLQAIYDYAFFHVIPAPRTIFQGVQRVPAGHVARLAQDRIDVAPYLVPTFEPPRTEPSFDALKTEFRRLLREAVQREYDGGVPGCFLSGGTDSSTVAGLLGEVAGRPAHTFTIGFEADGYDEMAFARITARHFRCEHHEYYVTPDDLVRTIPEVAASFDQPFGNSSALPAYHCARLAREHGVTRLLAGDGGDELFGGNSRYARQKIFDRYARLPGLLRRGLLEPLFVGGAGSRSALRRKAASYLEQARLPMPARSQLYNLVLRLGVDEVFEPVFLAQIDRGAPLALQQSVWDAAHADDALNRELAYDWRFTLAESDLPKVRGATALAGVEVGFPLLDEPLLELSRRLPPHWKVRGDKLRWFFKEALRGFLPGEILAKKKQGFGLPFGVWATRHEKLHALAADSVRGVAARGLVRPAFAESLLGERLHEHPGYFGEMVWILMMLEQWLRAHAPDFRLSGQA